MKKILLDSDIIIEILRRNQKIADGLKRMAAKNVRLFFSPVVLAEVRAGMRPKEKEATMGFFDALECIPISREIGEKAGRYLNQYHRSHGVELGDALIAASAFSEATSLLTLNRKHYPMKDIHLLIL